MIAQVRFDLSLRLAHETQTVGVRANARWEHDGHFNTTGNAVFADVLHAWVATPVETQP